MHVFTIFSNSLTSQSYMQNLNKIFDKANLPYLDLKCKKTEKYLSRTVYHTNKWRHITGVLFKNTQTLELSIKCRWFNTHLQRYQIYNLFRQRHVFKTV